jgi:DNA polymerase-3 subunit delta
MTAVKAADVDRYIARPDPGQSIMLVFGRDAGLVRERVDALVRASVDEPGDPFALARIESEALVADPARLIEEAHTMPLLGGRRAVLVRVASRHNIAAALEPVIAAPPTDCRVIIEAGDLKKTAPLRVLCEKAKVAAALPCYLDHADDVVRLIDEEMRAANLLIAPDARSELIGLLGGDRLASRSELRKLVLYCRGKARVALDDVRAVVSDASRQAIDGVLDAAFAGRSREVEAEFGKASAEGTPAAIISAAIRHVANLHKMRLAIDSGDSAEFAMQRGAPPVHFTRKDAVGSALRAWTAPRLLRVMQHLADASLEARRNGALAETIAQRTLLSLAVSARRKEP